MGTHNESNEHGPMCHVIAGPNGAGKTTFAMRYLPSIVACRSFINADMIAQGLSPLDTQAVQVEAGKMLLRRIDEMIARKADFAFETTLSGRGYARLFRRMRDRGYGINLFYLWIPSADFSARRVASRVANGGHDIPADAIGRRYMKSVRNLFDLYMPLADRTLLFDNSGETPVLILDAEPDGMRVADEARYARIRNQLTGGDYEQE